MGPGISQRKEEAKDRAVSLIKMCADVLCNSYPLLPYYIEMDFIYWMTSKDNESSHVSHEHVGHKQGSFQLLNFHCSGFWGERGLRYKPDSIPSLTPDLLCDKRCCISQAYTLRSHLAQQSMQSVIAWLQIPLHPFTNCLWASYIIPSYIIQICSSVQQR